MFNIDSFNVGEHGIVLYDKHEFRQFCGWAHRHGYSWAHGIDPAAEELHEDITGHGDLLNASNVRRYCGSRANIYVLVDGHLSQRQRVYANRNAIELFSFNNIPDETQVDEDGFEVETF